jgi:hypothetical protein
MDPAEAVPGVFAKAGMVFGIHMSPSEIYPHIIIYCAYRHSGGSRNPELDWMPDLVRHDELFKI